MDVETLLAPLATNNLPLLLGIAGLVIAVVALVHSASVRRTQQGQYDLMREKADSLWRELDDLRSCAGPSTSPEGQSPNHTATAEARYQTEKQAYDRLWPEIWQLHDRLGLFLRSVEAGEPAGELRLEARNAALEVRRLLNTQRPFCSEQVAELVTHLVDIEIKAHLTACRYLDMLKDVSAQPTPEDRQNLQEKYHTLYDGEARELMSQLAGTIRRRTITQG